MTQIILTTLGLILLTIFIIAYRLAKQHGTSVVDEVVGICAIALDQTVRKNENKEKIVALLRERGELNNADIREQLGFARTSVVRYMDELERERRVEQVGMAGRSVIYRLTS